MFNWPHWFIPLDPSPKGASQVRSVVPAYKSIPDIFPINLGCQNILAFIGHQLNILIFDGHTCNSEAKSHTLPRYKSNMQCMSVFTITVAANKLQSW